MELSRRDAIAALAAAGVAAGGALTLAELGEDDQSLGRREVETLVGVAEVVYPSRVTGVPAFVESFAVGRAAARPEYAEGLADAVATLDDAAGAWYAGPFRRLDADTRERLLRELGCDTAEPVPDGNRPERIRYYLVNEVLYALYASPTGGELVGVENPQGHPGGTASYQRGPDR